MAIDVEALMNDRDALKKLVAEYEQLKANDTEGNARELASIKGALDCTPDTLAIFDKDNILIYTNKAYGDRVAAMGLKNKLGIHRREVIARISHHLAYLDTDEKVEAFIDAQEKMYFTTLETGEPVDFSRVDNTHCRLNVRETAIGEFAYQQTDITAEKIREMDLSTILQSANQGIIFFDKDGHVQYMNSAFAKIMELQDFDVTPTTTMTSILDYVRREGFLAGAYENDEDWDEFAGTLKTATLNPGKTPSKLKLSDKKYVETLVKKFDDGRIMTCITDITDLRLKQKALKQETKKALAAEHAKSEFLANMSHEIRTPMNGVMGMAELLMGTELDTRQRTFADTIVKSGEALLTIINDILDFSKIDAGQIELQQAPFDLREAIEDVATLIAPRVASKNLELAVRIQPSLPDMFVGDAGRIRQIVTNLVGNAAKFTDTGQVIVEVSGEISDQGGTSSTADLVIRVKDTGIGIPKEKCATVFEKFSQVDTSATRLHEGTGLGLSITSSLTKLMGGEISVESEAGKGSVFTVNLALPIHGEAKRKRKTPVDVSGSTILVVDDNEVNRTILLEQMSAWGFSAKAATDGKKAIAMLEAAHMLGDTFDLIIMDYHMPEMTGAQTVSAIRKDTRFGSTPVVMLTSVDQMSEGKNFSSLGIQAHLTKPARSSLLMDTLINTLQDAKDNAESESEDEAFDTLQSTLDQNIAALREKAIDAATSADRSLRPEISASAQIESSPSTSIDILVAEDNVVNQAVFTSALEDMNFSFEIANNGSEAVELFQTLTPRIILMDISMPIMNGMEATAAIRKLEEAAGVRTPIIAVTAHAMSGDGEKYLAADMDDYMTKPVSVSKLKALVNRWINVDTASTGEQKSAG